MLTRQDIVAYAKSKYHIEADYPWKIYPTYMILRHKDTEKWFVLLMNVPLAKLGLAGEGAVDVCDIKADENMMAALHGKKGILPAYHMNKAHWLSLILDGSLPDKEILGLIDKSYALTL